MRVALRIIEERAELVSRMAAESRESGRGAVATHYEDRSAEYRRYADSIREVVLKRFESLSLPAPPG
jgi:two-component system chemotaxis response regulator CheB